MTKQEMNSVLKTMGLKRDYKPYWDSETEFIGLTTRKPPTLTDGVMTGSAIDVYDSTTIRIWTSQKKKANTIASITGCAVTLLDGEAELLLPVAHADQFLHQLGAKVRFARKPPSKEAIAKGQAALARLRAEKRGEQLPLDAASTTQT